MGGFAEFRCRNADCREFVLQCHRKGSIRPVGGAKIIGVDDGNPLVECWRCGSISLWPRKTVSASSLGYRLKSRAAPVDVESIINMMDERWALFSENRARSRPEVASGIRFDVLMRDDFRCRYCGLSMNEGAILHVDHVIPQSKGGPTTMENLVTACMDCNLGKSDKDLLTASMTG